MPLKLVAPRPGKTPYWSVRGTYLGVHVDRSTKTPQRVTAAKLLKKWRDEIERGSVSKPGEPTFLDAAVKYMAATGQERFLDRIVNKIGNLPLRLIDQTRTNDLALELYPLATPATRNRQVYTPVSAVLKNAGVKWDMERPQGWRGDKRTCWLLPDQAFLAFEAADKIDAEFGIFCRLLTYTGPRLSEATVRLPINGLSLEDKTAFVTKTKNQNARTLYLPPVLIAALANHPRGLDRPGETIFRFRKNGRLYELLNLLREALGARVTLDGFHTFRHTYGAWMRRYGGLDGNGLVATDTWKDLASVQRYEHLVASEEARKAILLPVENLWKARFKSPKPLKKKKA